ncbi:DMT family transporter [Conyzicola nivalis]|uniref:Membrane protein n=1 Tax=Conyzicola nivalis TaxID=1477021 RepID=A0A916WHR4_9MICO|nr:DMT family transporter [Conyzicola nivalis]GGB01152.1 membrane protein [Conyzicola nivalis]
MTASPSLPLVTRPAGPTPAVIVAIVVTVLAWASAFIVIRGTAPSFEGGALALARLVVGAALLSLVLIGKRWVAPTRREWLLIAGFGVIWFGGYNVALNIAEKTLDAGTTAMIVNIGPILIALGAGVFLREGIPKWLAIGAGVAFLGVVLIGIGTSGAGLGDGSGVLSTGTAWALVAAVTYAAGVLLQKPALKRLPAAQVTWLGCVIGLVACLPFAGQLVADLQTASPAAIAGAVYLGAVPTALAFSTWAYALARMPAGQLGVTTYIVPPLAIVLGFVVFAEIPAVTAIIGGAICLVGVALSRRRPGVRAVG